MIRPRSLGAWGERVDGLLSLVPKIAPLRNGVRLSQKVLQRLSRVPSCDFEEIAC
jgi:hypothetical protein